MNWLRKLDNWLFSPPHTFGTVFALVAARLALFTDDDAKNGTVAHDQTEMRESGESSTAKTNL